MAASNNPEKFFWKPAGLASEPARYRQAANAVDAPVGVRSPKRIQPAVGRNRRSVYQGNRRAVWLLESSISCTGESATMAIWDDNATIEIVATAREKRVVMVNNYQQFVIKTHLLCCHADCAFQCRPAIIAMCAHYYRH